MGGLTPKQSAFVREYLIDHNATQAAIRAGYSSATAAEQGSRLLINVKVQAEIQVEMDKLREQCGVTLQGLTDELNEMLEMARVDRKPSAGVSAIMAKAKLHNLASDRAEPKENNGVDIPSDMNAVRAWLASYFNAGRDS